MYVNANRNANINRSNINGNNFRNGMRTNSLRQTAARGGIGSGAPRRRAGQPQPAMASGLAPAAPVLALPVTAQEQLERVQVRVHAGLGLPVTAQEQSERVQVRVHAALGLHVTALPHLAQDGQAQVRAALEADLPLRP